VFVAALTLVGVGASTATAATHTQSGAGVGWVRVGHLAPAVPPVDIYLTPFGQAERLVIREAGYGAVTPYSTLPPGQYTWSMRLANSAITTPPALTAAVKIVEGTAYSLFVFATGPNGTPHPDLVTDTMTSLGTGMGMLRVVQGAPSATPVAVALRGGPALGSALAYGVTTSYVAVPAGQWPVVLSAGNTTSTVSITVSAGSVQTLLVTKQPDGLHTTAIVDGIGPAVQPLLGVQTGGGGTAVVPPTSLPVGWLLTAAAVIVLATVGALFSLRRRGFRVR
jgi:hypothetical protein